MLVPFGDPDALAEAIQCFVDAPARRAEVGRAARAGVLQRFDLRRLVGDISGLYAELLDGRKDSSDALA